MALYKVTIYGLGPAPLHAYFDAETDATAIREAARYSPGIGVAHRIVVDRGLGIAPITQVITRECGVKEYWG